MERQRGDETGEKGKNEALHGSIVVFSEQWLVVSG